MAKLRKGVAYRRIERPYTRISKYREISYIKGSPRILIVRFDMGNPKGKFKYEVSVVVRNPHQMRQNGIESARKAINRILEKVIGKSLYHFKIRCFPHHVLRENALASGAGADRLSTGMKQSFGKTVGRAIQLKKGQKIISVFVNEKAHIPIVKNALRIGKSKLPFNYQTVVSEVKE